ncbi:hypothetical protein MD484_g8853, partial [Candolleomyces efflorescens]
MASGARHESLNDHFNGMNHRKLVGLRTLLPKKLKEAAEMRTQHSEAFTKLSDTFSEELKSKWTDMVTKWDADPKNNPNPYEDAVLETTLQDVRLDLAKEDAQEAARGIISAHQTLVTNFLVTGLELEEQQRALKHEVKGNKLTTSKQKADLEDKRTALRRRINQWRDIQWVYAPCVISLLPSVDGTDDTAAENAELYLPSSIPASLHSTVPLLIERERKLREAQCDDALAEIRRQRRILTGLVQFKKLNLSGQGNKPNTRVRSLYNRIQAKIAKADMRYQTARGALCVLDPNGSWRQRLQVLHPADIRGPGKDTDDVSNGRYVMSWIWLVPRACGEGADAMGGKELDESLHVEWVKSRARLRRWEEEFLLVQEEMRRTVAYLHWKADWWQTRAALAPFKSDDVAHGVTAYAVKQASLCRCLSARFGSVWSPVLKSVGSELDLGGSGAASSVESIVPPILVDSLLDPEKDDSQDWSDDEFDPWASDDEPAYLNNWSNDFELDDD